MTPYDESVGNNTKHKGQQMEIHEVLEKVKESFSSFLIGIVLAGTCSYIVLDRLHSEKLEIVRLESKVQIDNLASELSSMNEQFAKIMNENTDLREKKKQCDSFVRIESLISTLDKEIRLKKEKLNMASGIDAITREGRENKEKSDYYTMLENELKSLQNQRDMARNIQIGSLSPEK